MNPENTHKRIQLNQNGSGKIEYCEGCDVVEMEMGPVSVRLQAQDLALFSTLIQEAEMHLRYHKLEKTKFEAGVIKVGEMH
ncbi:MAG: hypothetical protein OR997_08140 [Methylophilaceae bacterium]|nr:hypothetical protein [Methylophilaceae bacterium]